MMRLTFSVIFGLILISGKPCYSDSTEKIINVKCATCHGLQGISKGAGVPHLAGQPERYLKEQLEKYKSGERQHQIMSIIAGQLSDDEITTLASWYSKIKIQIVE
ncbi:cytochrome c [Betaproteobacteria bacterium]|nr:cytochrome c [Betaproteobacteria bacterium]